MDGKLRVVELFAGIGAQASALERLNIPFGSIVCEIDEKAFKGYCAIHGDTVNLGDITKVEHLPKCDLITYSFPCQDLSIAGARAGMKEGSGTRSGLLWEVGRLLQDMRERESLPEFLLMENVDAILNKQNIDDFKRWIQVLKDMGYTSEYKVMNAKDYGIPQSRKRCFMVSTRTKGSFIFPEGVPLTHRLKDLLETDVPESYYLSDERIARYEAHRQRQEENGRNFGWNPYDPESQDAAHAFTGNASRHTGNFIIEHDAEIEVKGSLNIPGRFESACRVYGSEGIAPTLPTAGGGGIVPKIEEPHLMIKGLNKDHIAKDGDGIVTFNQKSHAIAATATPGVVVKDNDYIKYPANTKKGYMEAYSGDGLVMSRPTKARGTVQPQGSPTLTTGTGCGTGVVVRDRSEDIPDMKDGDICAMLTPGRVEKRQNGRRFKNDGTSYTVTCQDHHGIAKRENGGLRIRYLTPRECGRLMGFTDEQITKISEVIPSKSGQYRVYGNSIVVDVLIAIFDAMLIKGSFEKRPTQTTLF